MKSLKLLFYFVFVVIISGCESDDDLITKMEQIKEAGNSNPYKALRMADSLIIQVRNESEYIQMKYDLLRLRLNDKADNLPSSDLIAKRVVDYFEENGSDLERQEADYYAGSVYRDLHDTPRALEYFYKSVDVADNCEKCDSIMLRNSYSQISFLLWSVQDYTRSLIYAKKEYEVAEQLNMITINCLMHLGVTYQYRDSIQKAKEWLDLAYDKLLETDTIKDSETIYNLIYNYSRIHDYKQAEACYLLSKQLSERDDYKSRFLNLGTYFELTNQTDSAIKCYKQVIDDNYDLFNVYDATKSIFSIYYQLGNYKEAANYACLFKNASDSLDLGRRQELAATVNNQYQYHLDKEKERRLKEEKDRLHYRNLIILFLAISIITLLGIALIYRRNRYLKRTLALSVELKGLKHNKEELLKNISSKEQELSAAQMSLGRTQQELETVKERLHQTAMEVEAQNKELKNKEKELADRIEQNRAFVSLLHQSDLEGKAEEVVYTIRQTSKGRRNMTAADWKQLILAIDDLYPNFYAQLTSKLSKLSEQQLHFCYLMKIGLTNTQIQNLTNLSRATVWRWFKKYSWILTPDDIKKR
jgi:tetratricopeptide (TPR) repeat protein